MAEDKAIATALASVRARITAAAAAAGRDPAGITLVAVSKTHPATEILAAIAAGQLAFGENRIQEADSKFPALLKAHKRARLHLIGPIQTNKVKDAARLAHVIETLDRPKLAEAIDRAAQGAGLCPDLLVQVNIGDEPQKSGIGTAAADEFIRAMRARFGDRLRGLMCIPPAQAGPAPYFQRLAAMADEHGLPVRSMGMSGDFETAIAHGATHIRIGSAIFGAR